MPMGVYPRKPLAVRFWAKVDRRDDDECWEWTGSRVARGYGHFAVDGRYPHAHRVAYELVVGPIPEGMQLDHLCRNPACVNPAHLEPVSPRVNTLRGIGGAAERAARTHCPQGHAYDEANTKRDAQNRRYCQACRRARARVKYWRDRDRILARLREKNAARRAAA